jgi:hypothetical protein
MPDATENLRRQHRKIGEIAAEIMADLKVDRVTKDAATARARLSRLSGVLTVHLSIEDGAMYPSLLTSGDAQARRVAKQFVDEMGTIKSEFDEFRQRWATPEAIQAGASAFVGETQGICVALLRRIEREERDLYPIVDRIGG